LASIPGREARSSNGATAGVADALRSPQF